MKKFIKSKCCFLLFKLILCGCSGDDEKSTIDVEIVEVNNITENSAVINARLNINRKEVSIRGICISQKANPTIEDVKYEVPGNIVGSYIGTFKDLHFNVRYYVRPYVITDLKIIYGKESTFTTKNVDVPTVTTIAPSSVLQITATSGGKIEYDGSSKIIAKGVCYSKINAVPTINDQKVEANTEDFEFPSSLIYLDQNTVYYVRAYATNVAGTGYGRVTSFTTSSFVQATVVTTSATSILENSAIAGGIVTNEGSNPVLQRGLCWSTSPNPTTSNSITLDGSGAGSFTSTLRNLQPSKLYYVRAYASSAAGGVYGETILLQTPAAVEIIGTIKPTVSASVRSIGSSAHATVKVINQGSNSIRNISVRCFDMEGKQVGRIISSSGWTNSNVYAPVTFEISGLSRNTKYYIVGYATSDVGTGTSEKSYFSI